MMPIFSKSQAYDQFKFLIRSVTFFCPVTFFSINSQILDFHKHQKEQMKILILALVMLVVSVTSIVSPSTNLQMSWANWILMDWAPSWPYTTWTKPALPTGYQKKVFSKNDPGANNRSWHYGYDNVDGTSSIYCGPESYLSPNFKCKRNPYYWDFAKVTAECDPDQVVLGLRKSCESQGKTTCCYRTNAGDLYSYSVTSTSYPLISP